MESIEKQLVAKQEEILELSKKAKQLLADRDKSADEHAITDSEAEIIATSIIDKQIEIAEIEYEVLLDEQYPGAGNISAEDAPAKIAALEAEIVAGKAELYK